MFRIRSLPIVDELISWISQSLPEMTFTPQRIRMNIPSPQLLSHPRWGPLVHLNPQSESPELSREAYVILTRSSMAVFNPATEEYRIQSLIPRRNAERQWRDLEIPREKVLRFWRRLRPWIAVFFFIIVFIVVYLWKILAKLYYSFIGLILNVFRKERLSYSSLLQLSFFVLSPVYLLQIITWSFPAAKIPLNFWTALLATTLYLGLTVLGTQEKGISSGN